MSQNEQVPKEKQKPLPQPTEQAPPTEQASPAEQAPPTEQALPEDKVVDAVAATEQEEQQKAEEYLDLLRRTQADFVNYRRRTAQEAAEMRVIAQIELLDRLLPIFDDLGRALGTIPPELSKDAWVQGLFLVARRLTTLFEQLGIRQLGTPGEKFDPLWHEALMVEPRADVPEGTILQVARPGYALGERVIRPAQVIVAGSLPVESDENDSMPAEQENAAGS